MAETISAAAFNLGLILPDTPDSKQELCHYQKELEFLSTTLENRRQMCSDLFRVGTNVLPDDQYYTLNLTYADTLQEEFPLMHFKTPTDFNTFGNTSTFYLAESLNSTEGDDILGNEYHLLSLVFVKICPGSPLGHYQLYSAEELIETFIYYNEFVDPKWSTYKSQRFTQAQIARLKKLCEKRAKNTIQAELFLKIIDLLSSAQSNYSLLIDSFEQHADANSEQTLKRLLEVSMYMRGWNGKGNYPLRAADTHNPICEMKLLNKLWQLYQSDHHVLNLPLWGQLNAMEHFIDVAPADYLHMSIDPAHGISIKDKLRIILQNHDGYACLRLGSNWLAATAWYYLNRFYNWQPFDITHLERIQ